MREMVLRVLTDIRPDIDFETETGLVSEMFATVIAELEEFSVLTGIDPEGTRILTEAMGELDKMGAGDIVMSQIGGHISRDILIISVLAFAIKKKN